MMLNRILHCIPMIMSGVTLLDGDRLCPLFQTYLIINTEHSSTEDDTENAAITQIKCKT